MLARPWMASTGISYSKCSLDVEQRTAEADGEELNVWDADCHA